MWYTILRGNIPFSQTADGGLYLLLKASISEKSGLVLFLCQKGGEIVEKNTCEKSIGKEKGHYIFRASRKNPKTGQIEYAKDYGKKAFKIWVND